MHLWVQITSTKIAEIWLLFSTTDFYISVIRLPHLHLKVRERDLISWRLSIYLYYEQFHLLGFVLKNPGNCNLVKVLIMLTN